MSEIPGDLATRLAHVMQIVDGTGTETAGDTWNDVVAAPVDPAASAGSASTGGTVGAAAGTTVEGQLEATLQERLNALFAAAPGNVTIASGFRTRAQQEVLYAKYKAGTGNLAAKPGTSKHEHGAAADLNYASPAVQKWVHDHAAEYGLSFPINGEPWHAELAGGRG